MGLVMADQLARSVVKALSGKWQGSYGVALCPVHDDRHPSLSISEQDGKLLVHCFAGCDQGTVWEALTVRGLVVGGDCNRLCRQRQISKSRDPSVRRRTGSSRIDQALAIWRASDRALGTLVETYLRSRGITILIPPALRYYPAARHDFLGSKFPCMVAAVRGHDRQITAVHRTYLQHDGRAKADVSNPKLAKGHLSNGAVRLAAAGKALGIAEGIETALSAMQLWDIPTWAVLGSRLESTAVPPTVIEIQIFGDNGQAGHAAAEKAAKHLLRLGHRVALRFPPEPFGDWNDVLQVIGGAQ